MVLVGGLLVVGIGILLLPLPGPGFLVIFLGLGILATEFAWARRLLASAREYFRRRKEQALRKRRGRPGVE